MAKVHKLRDRLAGGAAGRIADKDASDVYRIMLTIPVGEVMFRLRPMLADEKAGPVCRDAVDLLAQLFGVPGAEGVGMAIAALRVAVPLERVVDVCVGFVRQLMAALDGP